MDKIIGLGKTGCALAEEFTAYPEYRIYKILDESNERGTLELGTYSSMDQYEENVDEAEVSSYLRSVKEGDGVLFILCGGDPITGAALRILKCIKDATINVLYVCPDREMSSTDSRTNDKIAFNILQQYARSGVFNNLFLSHYPTVETLIGDASIEEYDKKINYFITYALAMINFFEHSPAVVNGKLKPLDWASISSLGIGSLDTEEINFLFPLQDTTEMHFYFGIPEEDLKRDQSLMKKIKEFVRSFRSDGKTVSFSVHPTTFEGIMVLCHAFSTQIQSLVE